MPCSTLCLAGVVAGAALLLTAPACNRTPTAAGDGPVAHMRAPEIHQLMTENPEGVFVLDVRTPGEVAAGAIAGADAAADWNAWGRSYAAVAERVAAAETVVVYCRSGARSAAAAQWLGEQGIGNVVNLVGGIGAWQSAGLPLSRGL